MKSFTAATILAFSAQALATGSGLNIGVGASVAVGADVSLTAGTANEISANDGCKALTVIFARGSGEIGNIGKVCGPSLYSSLTASLGVDAVAFQGCDYDATISANAGVSLGDDGASVMAGLCTQALSQCPDTKIVLAGYSQGAAVVHAAAGLLDAASISAAVVFGDALGSESFGSCSSNIIKSFCADGDSVCTAGSASAGVSIISEFSAGISANAVFGIGASLTAGLDAHLSYSADADAAASFIVGTCGL